MRLLGTTRGQRKIIIHRWCQYHRLRRAFSQDFLDRVGEKLGGAICMHYDEDQGRGQFLWTHTTASMGIAYQTTSDVSATTCMSRINDVPRDAKGNPKGTCILVES